jgi:Zn-dependent membrane protease YugP
MACQVLKLLRKMLADNGIRESDFNPGRLTDHYNPDKTVNLSEAL